MYLCTYFSYQSEKRREIKERLTQKKGIKKRGERGERNRGRLIEGEIEIDSAEREREWREGERDRSL